MDLEVVRELAWFRYTLRRFLRFSEKAARACGVTPQQHQLMLGVSGFSKDGTATISELAEFLQERNHSVVGLVERAAAVGLVRRDTSPADRRLVLVRLTARGERILTKLSRLHRDEVERVKAGMLSQLTLEQHAAGNAEHRPKQRGRGRGSA
ncbi:MAG TPA: MarR family winged helix-turn-helix transcriptional regulator [Terracidiphilus sp.]|nr:MarR family winged helix-turn-helix transcriptional regulator [Terracidiphilus sp.]